MTNILVTTPPPVNIIVQAAAPKGDKGDAGTDGTDGDPGVGLPAGGTTGQIAAKASATDYDVAWIDAPSGGASDTAEEILAKLITVDGTGSDLDADLLDGQHASAFAAAGHNHAGIYDPAGTAAAEAAIHEAASDPHPQYLTATEGDAAYAPVAKGVTNGDAHDHSGGDGSQIAYTSLSGLPTIPAAQVNSDWGASSGVAQILNKPTLGTAAAAATTDFDAAGTAAAAVSAHASGTGVHSIASTTGLQTALDGKEASGTAASAVSTHAAVTSGVHGISTFGASLVDDTSASAARTTLGLGDSATKNVGTATGTVAAGDDSRLSRPFTRGATFVNSSALTTGVNNVKVRIPVAGTISSASIETLGGTGSVVIDVQKSGASICGSNKPTIASGTEYVDSTLTGWGKTLSAGDVLTFIVNSVSVFTYACIDLLITPT